MPRKRWSTSLSWSGSNVFSEKDKLGRFFGPRSPSIVVCIGTKGALRKTLWLVDQKRRSSGKTDQNCTFWLVKVRSGFISYAVLFHDFNLDYCFLFQFCFKDYTYIPNIPIMIWSDPAIWTYNNLNWDPQPLKPPLPFPSLLNPPLAINGDKNKHRNSFFPIAFLNIGVHGNHQDVYLMHNKMKTLFWLG